MHGVFPSQQEHLDMDISGNNGYPVYLDISPQDIQDITAQSWDTLRVLVISDTLELVVATGYGNTHSTMVRHLTAHKKMRRIQTDDSIIYFEREKIAYANDTCFGQGEKIPVSKWDILYESQHIDILKLLCIERGLKMT